VLFLFLGFRQGAEDQINSTIRKSYGDIRLTARGDRSLKEVKQYLCENYDRYLERTASQLSLQGVRLTGSGNYRESRIVGVREDYFRWLGDSIYWKSGGPPEPRGETPVSPVNGVLEKSYAKKLNLKQGDTITAVYESVRGATGKLRIQVSGVFIGNRFQKGGKLFLPLKTVQELTGETGKIDLVKINLVRPTEVNLDRIASLVSDKYRMTASVSVRKWNRDLTYSTIFSRVWALMGVILVLSALTIILVLSLGIYDTFYLDLRSRAEEISTLLTYGIHHGKLYLLNFLEITILLVLGGGAGLLLALTIALILANIPLVKNFSYLFIVLGGPFLQFSLFTPDLLIGFGVTSLAAYFASCLSLRSYLRGDVAEIVD